MDAEQDEKDNTKNKANGRMNGAVLECVGACPVTNNESKTNFACMTLFGL